MLVDQISYTSDMRLPDYMAENFPGLELGPALFYNWTVGIRFELAVGPTLDLRLKTAVDRACQIYEAAFQPEDRAILVSEQIRYEDGTPNQVFASIKGRKPRHDLGTIFQLARKALHLPGPAGRHRVVESEDAYVNRISTRRWTRIKPRLLDYRTVLLTRANQDFPGRKPRTNDAVYFINYSRNVIFNMYDDRGMDVIASDRMALRPVYTAFNAWILEHDRCKIEALFAQE